MALGHSQKGGPLEGRRLFFILRQKERNKAAKSPTPSRRKTRDCLATRHCEERGGAAIAMTHCAVTRELRKRRGPRHCEERSDEAIQKGPRKSHASTKKNHWVASPVIARSVSDEAIQKGPRKSHASTKKNH
jgi:hypothetical protein